MEELYGLARGYARRFPAGNDPFQMITRLAEETGELAAEVNHWEGSGVKRAKHGEPSREHLAGEIKNVLTCALQVALYYGVEAELAASIADSLARMRREGLIEP